MQGHKPIGISYGLAERKVSISAEELRGYVPNGTPSEMKAFIRKACEHYSDYLKKKREESR